ncbi:MAG: prepilin-type N-terminal cleavage/methylation domain-containing protein [Longimicrobiales bacterium]
MQFSAGDGRAGSFGQAGFTIVEVLMALVLLSFMVMGFQAATGEIIHYAAQSDREAVAVQLVEDRLDLIRMDPEYTRLEDRYETEANELTDYPGLTRTTNIVRTYQEQATGVLDYLKITVTVSGASLRGPVARTIVIGAP